MAKTPNAASIRRAQMRQQLWPDVTDEQLWLRTQKTGFTTIPRTLTLIGRIIDSISKKGMPLASTYLALWCWVFDEAFVEIRNPKELAYESGFSGPRSESIWKERMRRLEKLGFIRSKRGIAGDFHYVLLLNPIRVIAERHLEAVSKSVAYNALLSRLLQVGADDLDLPLTTVDGAVITNAPLRLRLKVKPRPNP